MSVTVGRTAVAIVPSFAGFQAELKKGMAPGKASAAAEGREAGKGYGKGFTEGSRTTSVGGAPPVDRKKVRSEGESAGKEFGGGFLGSTKSVLEGLGAFAAFDFLKDAIKDGNQMSSTMNVLRERLLNTNDAVGISAESLKSYAESVAEVDGTSAQTQLSIESMLLTFTNIRGAIFEDALPVINDLSTSLKIGLPQATKMVGRALNDPVKGLNALSRAGVTFSASQQQTIKSLAESGRMAQAQGIIIQSLEGRVGGAAHAAVTPVQQLRAEWYNFTEQVGEMLIPAVNKFLILLNSKVIPALSRGAKWIDQNRTAVLAFVATMAGIIAFTKAMMGLKVAIEAVKLAMKGGVWGLVALAVAVVIAALIKFHLITPIIHALRAAWDVLVRAFHSSVGFFSGVWNAIVSGFNTVRDVFLRGVHDVIAPFVRLKNFVVGSFDGWWATHAEQVKQIWHNLWTAIHTIIQVTFVPTINMIRGYVGMFVNIIRSGMDIVRSIFTVAWALVRGIFAVEFSIIRGIISAGLAIWTAVFKVTIGVIIAAFKIFWDVLVGVFSVFLDLVTGKWGRAWQDIKNMAIQVWNAIKGAFSTFTNALSELGRKLVGYFLNDFWHPISNFFTSTLPSAFQKGRDAIGKIWGDVKNIVMAPIKFLVETVYDNGIARIWNDTAGAVGLPKLPIEHFGGGGGSSAPSTGARGNAGKVGFATGGRVPDGYPNDSYPAWVESGEAIVPAHLTPAIAPFLAANGVPGFSSGWNPINVVKRIGHDIVHPGDAIKDIRDLAGDAAGAVLRGAYNGIVKPLVDHIPAAGRFTDMLKAIPPHLIDKMVSVIKGHQDQAMAAGAIGKAASTAQVRAWIAEGMQIAGVSGPDWTNGLTTIAMHESGGNPTIVNTTDSNAKRGTPSAGLMQFIKPTFDAYAMPGHTDWMNPVDQVVADAWAHGYIRAAYGDIRNVPGVAAVGHGAPYVGYDNGGPLMPGVTNVWNGTGGVEGVLNTTGMDALSRLNAGKDIAGNTYISVKIGETELTDIVDARIERDNVESARLAEGVWSKL